MIYLLADAMRCYAEEKHDAVSRIFKFKKGIFFFNCVASHRCRLSRFTKVIFSTAMQRVNRATVEFVAEYARRSGG